MLFAYCGFRRWSRSMAWRVGRCLFIRANSLRHRQACGIWMTKNRLRFQSILMSMGLGMIGSHVTWCSFFPSSKHIVILASTSLRAKPNGYTASTPSLSIFPPFWHQKPFFIPPGIFSIQKTYNLDFPKAKVWELPSDAGKSYVVIDLFIGLTLRPLCLGGLLWVRFSYERRENLS